MHEFFFKIFRFLAERIAGFFRERIWIDLQARFTLHRKRRPRRAVQEARIDIDAARFVTLHRRLIGGDLHLQPLRDKIFHRPAHAAGRAILAIDKQFGAPLAA